MAHTGQLWEESLPFKEVIWKIPDFLERRKRVGHNIDSPPFSLSNATWCLRLFPNGEYANDSANHIDLYLVRIQSSIPEHRMHFKIGFKTRRGKEYESFEDERSFCRFEEEHGVVRYLERSRVESCRKLLMPNRTVTVFCQMRVMAGAGEIHSPEQHRTELSRTERREASSQTDLQGVSSQTDLQEASSQTDLQEASSQTELQEASFQPDLQEAFSQTDLQEASFQTPMQEASSQTEVIISASPTEVQEASTSVQKLQSDYKKLLQSGEDTDVCLKVSDKEFQAHKCILRARSEVFSSMFKYEMEEKTSGKVVIEDLDPSSFPDFLQHLYAGSVEALSDENVFNLYSAADKYDVQELKSECLEYMKRSLSIGIFCDVMILALRHKEEDLLNLATNFFQANLSEIIVTIGWQIFLRDFHVEANELLIKAFVKNDWGKTGK